MSLTSYDSNPFLCIFNDLSRNVNGHSWKNFRLKKRCETSNTRWYIRREFNSRHTVNDYDLIFLFKDYARILYRKCRLVMKSVVVAGKLNYSLTLHMNTNKYRAFKFTDEILFIHFILKDSEAYDL